MVKKPKPILFPPTLMASVGFRFSFNLVAVVFLTCSASVSVFNDGNSRDLMSLAGTIPVSYRGNKYVYDGDQIHSVILIMQF